MLIVKWRDVFPKYYKVGIKCFFLIQNGLINFINTKIKRKGLSPIHMGRMLGDNGRFKKTVVCARL